MKIGILGAGDGFVTGVVSALFKRHEVCAVIWRGAWIGARAVQTLGNTEGLPTREDLIRGGF